MNLHSGTPFWPLRDGLSAVFPPLGGAEDTEVAILGAGITGALIAHSLAEAGVPCVVLDRRDAASGSTAASTALLQYELDVPLHRLASMIGEQNAVRVYKLCLRSLDRLGQIDRSLGGGHGFRRRQSLQGAARKAHAAALRREADIRSRNGFDVELLDRRSLRKLCALPYHHALLSEDAAEVDAYLLTGSLLMAAAKAGANIHDRTAVTRMRRARNGNITLWTDRGHCVRARHLVIATGYETRPYLPDGIVSLVSTYALVTEPQPEWPGWPENCLIWETGRPYCYLRRTPDGRVIAGGYDEPLTDPAKRDEMLPAKAAALLRKLRRLLPGACCETAWSWCGTFAETRDGMPHIGPRPDGPPNVYFALGYGGNGITFSQLASEIIRDLVVEGQSPEADLFRFDRPSARD